MQIPVLIEPVKGNGFVARTGEPFGWSAEGATEEEALQRLREVAAERALHGASVATVEVPTRNNPLLAWAGTLKGHPLLEDWKRAVADYRKGVDNDAERL
jgi:hypothetical protein